MRRAPKHLCYFLGEMVAGDNLADLFAEVIDLADYLDPGGLNRFSQMRTHARAYIARNPESVHRTAKHLRTKRTKSGWYVSRNVSRSQVVGALRHLCECIGLEFGSDIRFPARQWR